MTFFDPNFQTAAYIGEILVCDAVVSQLENENPDLYRRMIPSGADIVESLEHLLADIPGGWENAMPEARLAAIGEEIIQHVESQWAGKLTVAELIEEFDAEQLLVDLALGSVGGGVQITDNPDVEDFLRSRGVSRGHSMGEAPFEVYNLASDVLGILLGQYHLVGKTVPQVPFDMAKGTRTHGVKKEFPMNRSSLDFASELEDLLKSDEKPEPVNDQQLTGDEEVEERLEDFASSLSKALSESGMEALSEDEDPLAPMPKDGTSEHEDAETLEEEVTEHAGKNPGESKDEGFDVTDELAQDLAKKMGYKGDLSELKAGLIEEQEHGKIAGDNNVTDDNPLITGKIVMVHLLKDPKYYTDEKTEGSLAQDTLPAEAQNIDASFPVKAQADEDLTKWVQDYMKSGIKEDTQHIYDIMSSIEGLGRFLEGIAQESPEVEEYKNLISECYKSLKFLANRLPGILPPLTKLLQAGQQSNPPATKPAAQPTPQKNASSFEKGATAGSVPLTKVVKNSEGSLKPIYFGSNTPYYEVDIQASNDTFAVNLTGGSSAYSVQGVDDHAFRTFVYKAKLLAPHNNWADAGFVYGTAKEKRFFTAVAADQSLLLSAFDAMKASVKNAQQQPTQQPEQKGKPQ